MSSAVQDPVQLLPLVMFTAIELAALLLQIGIWCPSRSVM